MTNVVVGNFTTCFRKSKEEFKKTYFKLASDPTDEKFEVEWDDYCEFKARKIRKMNERGRIL